MNPGDTRKQLPALSQPLDSQRRGESRHRPLAATIEPSQMCDAVEWNFEYDFYGARTCFIRLILKLERK